eukprot:SAG11_NODE_26381_length_346_cov_0.611336_1_plen_48_part_01
MPSQLAEPLHRPWVSSPTEVGEGVVLRDQRGFAKILCTPAGRTPCGLA